MKRILYILALASITACNSKKPEPAQVYAATPNGLADLQKAATAKTTSTPVSATQSNLLLNPAHGEPGHDCSIAVGAPLKQGAKNIAAPQPQAVQTVSQASATVNNETQAAVSSVNSKAQKLNPAHGQPGHDCAIAVGAPLNAKPTKVVSATTPQVNVSQPAASTTSAVPVLNEKGQRLNPAHGQPGHKCEVAVGAPLT